MLTSTQRIIVNIFKSLCNPNENLEYVKKCVIDWDDVFECLNEQKMFVMAYNRVINFVPIEEQQKWKDYYQFCRIKMKLYMDEITKIFREANEKGINLLMIKGFAFSHYIYDDFYSRQFEDIDTLINISDANIIDRILRKLGYKQIYISPDGCKEELYSTELKDSNHHEYCEYEKKAGEYDLNIEVAIFLHDCVRLEYIGNFLKNKVTIEKDNISFETLDLYHIFINLCENTYSNFEGFWANTFKGRKCLRDFIDLYKFLEKYINQLSLDILYSLSKSYNVCNVVTTVIAVLSDMLNERWLKEIYELWLKKGVEPYKEKRLSIYEYFFNNFNEISLEYYLEVISKTFSYRNRNYFNCIQGGLSGRMIFPFGDREDNFAYMFRINKHSICIEIVCNNIKFEEIGNYMFLVTFLRDKGLYARTMLTFWMEDQSNKCKIRNDFCLEKKKENTSKTYSISPKKYFSENEDGGFIINYIIPYSYLDWTSSEIPIILGCDFEVKIRKHDKLYHAVYHCKDNEYEYIIITE